MGGGWCTLCNFLLVSDLVSELVQFAFSAALLCTPVPRSLSAAPGSPEATRGLNDKPLSETETGSMLGKTFLAFFPLIRA